MPPLVSALYGRLAIDPVHVVWRFEHKRRGWRQEHQPRDPTAAVAGQVADSFAAADRVRDQRHTLEVQVFEQAREILGERLVVVSAAGVVEVSLSGDGLTREGCGQKCPP
jgi:hypothetical protein